ncbi:integrase/DNA-binding transcriptional regulator YhcF (GntR family) [Actinopolyspora lacussalsi]|nr:integrase/DNA-binding transcriptional regulator YhcF (GntR family) [Actinopolyspora lacussalsi]
MGRRSKGTRRQRGTIDQLSNGALRVRVSAGLDPVTKQRHRLIEVVPPGPQALAEAERVRTRLLNEVDERRSPRTQATVEQLLERYLDQHFDGEPSTKANYRRYARLHVLPFIGQVKVGQLDADALDSLYAELRRCRDHCSGKRRAVDHRTWGEHECDDRCRRHECKPLGATTIRHIHFLLSGAFKRAVRWKWVASSPVGQAEPPAAPPPRPSPPSAEEAARILNEAWRRDADWGALVWTVMTTGIRRGELCAVRWQHVDLESGVLRLEQAVAFDDEAGEWFVKDTKTHQQRRIALDAETTAVLAGLRARQEQRVGDLGLAWSREMFVFSPEPDGQRFAKPDSVTQRYDRMVRRLGISTTLHKLRHYSATELISAGVDPRTVAGRLGHGGGGVTTLRVYSAWVSEADQRASRALFERVPERPDGPRSVEERAKIAPENPYERIASDIRAQIAARQLTDGAAIPSLKKLMAEYDVASATASRAVSLLKTWGLVETTGAGQPNTVSVGACEALATEAEHSNEIALRSPEEPPRNWEPTSDSMTTSVEEGPRMLSFELRYLGELVRTFTAEADPGSADHLKRLLTAAVRRDGRSDAEILDYELDVRDSDGELITTFVKMAA